MINIIHSSRNRYPLNRLIAAQTLVGCRIKTISYDKLFGEKEITDGTLIFTDFDHLHAYEIDAAARAADAVLQHAPRSIVLNHPAHAMQRTAMLSRLKHVELNSVEVTRVDTGAAPTRYPVFLREEDGCGGPETGLLHDETAYRAALTEHTNLGKSLARRIAVSFEAEKDRDGFYRKYGAFVIGDHVVPQHILRSEGWNVKSVSSKPDEAFVAEELAFVTGNPHREALLRIAREGHIEYARIDYGLVSDEIVFFEANTNPTFPNFRFGNAARADRRRHILRGLSRAFQEIDRDGSGARIPFRYNDIANSGFVEKEHWTRHPIVALRKPGLWNKIVSRLRLTEVASPKRWKAAYLLRLQGLHYHLSRFSLKVRVRREEALHEDRDS